MQQMKSSKAGAQAGAKNASVRKASSRKSAPVVCHAKEAGASAKISKRNMVTGVLGSFGVSMFISSLIGEPVAQAAVEAPVAVAAPVAEVATARSNLITPVASVVALGAVAASAGLATMTQTQKTELASQEATLNKALRELKGLTERNNTLESELRTERLQGSRKINELTTAISKKEAEVTRVAGEVSALRQQAETLNKRLATSEAAANAVQAQAKASQSKVNALERQCAELTTNYNRTSAELKDLRALAAVEKSKVEQLTGTLKTTQEQAKKTINDIQAAEERMRRELGIERVTVTRLREELKSSKAENEVLTSTVSESTEQLTKLRAEYETVNAQLQEQQQQIDEAQAQYAQLQELVLESEKRNSGLEEQLGSAMDKLQLALREKAMVEADVAVKVEAEQELLGKLDGLAAKLESVEVELEQTRSAKRASEVELAQTRQYVQRLETASVNLQKSQEAAVKELVESQGTLKQANTQLEALRTKAAQYQSTAEAYAAQVAELKENGTRRESMLAAMINAEKGLTEAATRIRGELLDAQIEVEDLKSRLSSATQDLGQGQIREMQLKNELELNKDALMQAQTRWLDIKSQLMSAEEKGEQVGSQLLEAMRQLDSLSSKVSNAISEHNMLLKRQDELRVEGEEQRGALLQRQLEMEQLRMQLADTEIRGHQAVLGLQEALAEAKHLSNELASTVAESRETSERHAELTGESKRNRETLTGAQRSAQELRAKLQAAEALTEEMSSQWKVAMDQAARAEASLFEAREEISVLASRISSLQAASGPGKLNLKSELSMMQQEIDQLSSELAAAQQDRKKLNSLQSHLSASAAKMKAASEAEEDNEPVSAMAGSKVSRAKSASARSKVTRADNQEESGTGEKPTKTKKGAKKDEQTGTSVE